MLKNIRHTLIMDLHFIARTTRLQIHNTVKTRKRNHRIRRICHCTAGRLNLHIGCHPPIKDYKIIDFVRKLGIMRSWV